MPRRGSRHRWVMRHKDGRVSYPRLLERQCWAAALGGHARNTAANRRRLRAAGWRPAKVTIVDGWEG